jgi:hypothetical protein
MADTPPGELILGGKLTLADYAWPLLLSTLAGLSTSIGGLVSGLWRRRRDAPCRGRDAPCVMRDA